MTDINRRLQHNSVNQKQAKQAAEYLELDRQGKEIEERGQVSKGLPTHPTPLWIAVLVRNCKRKTIKRHQNLVLWTWPESFLSPKRYWQLLYNKFSPVKFFSAQSRTRCGPKSPVIYIL